MIATRLRLGPVSCGAAMPPLSVAPLPGDDWKRRVAEALTGGGATRCCGVGVMAKMAKSTAYLKEAFGSGFARQIAGLNIYQRCMLCWLVHEATYGSVSETRVWAINELDRLVEQDGSLSMSVLAENALQRLDFDDFLMAMSSNFDLLLAVRLVELSNKYQNRLLTASSSHLASMSASFVSGRGLEGWLRDYVVPLAKGSSSWANQLLESYWKTETGSVDFRKLYVLLKAGLPGANETAIKAMFFQRDVAQFLSGLAFMKELASSGNLEDVIFAVNWPQRNYRKVRTFAAVMRDMDAVRVVSIRKSFRYWSKAMREVDITNLQRIIAAYIPSAARGPEGIRCAESTARGAVFALQELAKYGNEAARDYLDELTVCLVPRLSSMAQAAVLSYGGPSVLRLPRPADDDSDGHE